MLNGWENVQGQRDEKKKNITKILPKSYDNKCVCTFFITIQDKIVQQSQSNAKLVQLKTCFRSALQTTATSAITTSRSQTQITIRRMDDERERKIICKRKKFAKCDICKYTNTCNILNSEALSVSECVCVFVSLRPSTTVKSQQ